MRIIALLLSIIALASCAESEFSISGEALELESTEDAQVLFFSGDFSIPEDTYTFRISGPMGLVWEGAMIGEGMEKRSEPLEITQGARFPEGTYTILIYSSGGTEAKLEKELSY